MRRRHKVTLAWHSPFTVEECLRRLHAACDEERLRWLGYAGYAGSRPVIARFDGPRFTIYRRSPRPGTAWRRGDQLPLVLLSGRCEPAAAGTSFKGGTRVHCTSAAVLLGVALSVASGAALVSQQLADALWLPLLYAGVVAAVGGTLWYGYVTGVRREREYLTRFLREVLIARDAGR